jgi:hypothetical protein
MEFVRVFTNPQRCMQRLGFLKHLLWRASQSATNNLSTLGKDLVTAVTQRIAAVLTPELDEYISTASADSRHKSLGRAAPRDRDGCTEQTRVEVEIQEFFLAHLDVPSRRGRLVKDDWRRYPHLAVNLGLLRKGTYSLLVRGQAFLGLVSDEEKKGFVRDASGVLATSASNPLRLTPQQKLILLYSLVRNDGDILRELFSRLLQINDSFTDWQAGDYLPDIYRKVAKESRHRVRSGDDLVKIQRLLDSAANIERWKGKRYKGKGARDEAATIRLEPLVDLGLLSKPDPFAYRYLATEATKIFLGLLTNSESIEEFLDHSFFAASSRALAFQGEHDTRRETILVPLQKAYNILRSPLGYVPILEVALLSGISSLTESGKYFEISEAMETLKSLQREAPEFVTFNVDRWGGLSVVKFKHDIAQVTK